MSTVINGSSPSITFSDGTTQSTAANISSPYTANGVVYASSTSALATGSALSFTGTSLSVNASGSNLTLNNSVSTGQFGTFLQYSGTTYGQLTMNIQTGEMRLISGESGQSGYFTTFYTSGTEAMRLDSSQNLLVGTTSAYHYGKLSVACNSGTYSDGLTTQPVTNANYFAAVFCNNGGTVIGTISCTTSSTAFNTSSDQRLKTNIVDAPQGNIDAIKVRSFDWIADGTHQEYGMIAQELIEVAPYAVSVPRNSEDMMGVDYSKLVPMMIKEIQSLKAEVAKLKGA